MSSKKDLKWCQELAKARNGKCLSATYVNNHHRYLWEYYDENPVKVQTEILEVLNGI